MRKVNKLFNAKCAIYECVFMAKKNNYTLFCVSALHTHDELKRTLFFVEGKRRDHG